MDNTQRAWVEIDLDSVAHNIREIKKCLKPDVRLMATVKADAYGHGVCETAKTILENGADALAVAFIDEAIELRQYGITVPILILGNSPQASIDDILEYDITPAVFTMEFAKALSKRAALTGRTVNVHIKVDTGMHRIGFLYSSNAEECAKTIENILEVSKLPGIKIEGIFSHFSTSDEEDTAYTLAQLENFKELTEKLENSGLKIPLKHIANSAAIIKYPEAQFDMVRAGVIMYGMYPSDWVKNSGVKLKPAMSFKTRIVSIKTLQKGSGISYGKTYITDQTKKIATISVGYADGYSRVFSGKVNVLVDGKKVKQLGRICMDQCMIDVTTVNNIDIGDVVTLFGVGDGGSIPIEELADVMGTINYEVSCMIGRRIPRVYIKGGKQTRSVNYLLDIEG